MSTTTQTPRPLEPSGWREVVTNLYAQAASMDADNAAGMRANGDAERVRATATEIHRACNSHAALVAENAALKRREEAALNIATDRTEEHIKFQKQRDALVAALDKAELLLAGWRTTHEEGRHSNAPINGTRQWLSEVAALKAVKGAE